MITLACHCSSAHRVNCSGTASAEYVTAGGYVGAKEDAIAGRSGPRRGPPAHFGRGRWRVCCRSFDDVSRLCWPTRFALGRSDDQVRPVILRLYSSWGCRRLLDHGSRPTWSSRQRGLCLGSSVPRHLPRMEIWFLEAARFNSCTAASAGIGGSFKLALGASFLRITSSNAVAPEASQTGASLRVTIHTKAWGSVHHPPQATAFSSMARPQSASARERVGAAVLLRTGASGRRPSRADGD